MCSSFSLLNQSSNHFVGTLNGLKQNNVCRSILGQHRGSVFSINLTIIHHKHIIDVFVYVTCPHNYNVSSVTRHLWWVASEHFLRVAKLLVCSGEIVLMAAAFPGLRSLCLAINKSLWITGEAGSQCSCVRVWAGQWNDWSSGGLRARKNAVWWDCRLGGRGGEGWGTGADCMEGNKRHTSRCSEKSLKKNCVINMVQ